MDLTPIHSEQHFVTLGPRFDSLPAELILRVIDWLPSAALSVLYRTSSGWNSFICTHEQVIFASKVDHAIAMPQRLRSPYVPPDARYLTKSFHSITSWKNLCMKQVLLRRRWMSMETQWRTSVIKMGRRSVWRFRADFGRRLILSTHKLRGLVVNDMDDGRQLWQHGVSLLDLDVVGSFSHLEYSDGNACWSNWGRPIEIWKHDDSLDSKRGHFFRVALIPEDPFTRGFMLRYPTFCVVSTAGIGIVWDVSHSPPRQLTKCTIKEGAVGHLTQDSEVVMFSMGQGGFDLHSKTTGQKLGNLNPGNDHVGVFQVVHPSKGRTSSGDHKSSFLPLRVEPADPLSRASRPLREDEWGAASLEGSIMAGISRGGRLCICRDWKRAIKSADAAKASIIVYQFDYRVEDFDLGGWLSIRNGRVAFQVQNYIYLYQLPANGSNTPIENHDHGTFSAILDVEDHIRNPISCLEVTDDGILSTHLIAVKEDGFNPEFRVHVRKLDLGDIE